MKSVLHGIVAASLVLAVPAVSAHHSFAMYDQAQTRTFTGKLTRFIPGANHAQLLFEVLDENGVTMLDAAGKPVMWGVEAGPVARIAKQGVTPDNFPNGTGLINCGKQFPAGGCTATTGKVYLAENN